MYLRPLESVYRTSLIKSQASHETVVIVKSLRTVVADAESEADGCLDDYGLVRTVTVLLCTVYYLATLAMAEAPMHVWCVIAGCSAREPARV